MLTDQTGQLIAEEAPPKSIGHRERNTQLSGDQHPAVFSVICGVLAVFSFARPHLPRLRRPRRDPGLHGQPRDQAESRHADRPPPGQRRDRPGPDLRTDRDHLHDGPELHPGRARPRSSASSTRRSSRRGASATPCSSRPIPRPGSPRRPPQVEQEFEAAEARERGHGRPEDPPACSNVRKAARPQGRPPPPGLHRGPGRQTRNASAAVGYYAFALYEVEGPARQGRLGRRGGSPWRSSRAWRTGATMTGTSRTSMFPYPPKSYQTAGEAG